MKRSESPQLLTYQIEKRRENSISTTALVHGALRGDGTPVIWVVKNRVEKSLPLRGGAGNAAACRRAERGSAVLRR